MQWTISRLAAAFFLLFTTISPTFAQGTRVVVPDRPGSPAINGCFRANQTLFGPYRLTFCLERRGSYQVRGNGLSCDGRLSWRNTGRQISIDLARSSCGRGRAWEAAAIDCTVTLPGAIRGIQRLSCTYHPSVPRFGARRFTASRV